MNEQTDEQNLALTKRLAMEQLLDSSGWKILDEILKEKIDSLRGFRTTSNNSDVVLACVREEDGINFVYETIEAIIEDGIS